MPRDGVASCMFDYRDNKKPMEILKSLHKKQVNNGIFIALLLVFAAGIATWWFYRPAKADSSPHPLSQADTVPLCSLLPKLSAGVRCQDAQPQITVAGHSMWKDASNNPVLRADLVTTYNLSMTAPMTSSAWFASALPEIKASGRQDWDEPKGAWAQAAITRKGKEQEILLEDNGIVLILQSSVLDRAALLSYANETTKALRAAKPVIASGGDATAQ
jgi:hypothetical protein